MGTIKERNGKDLTEEKILRRGSQNTQNCTKKVLMTRITMTVWLLTKSQTTWRVKSSEP